MSIAALDEEPRAELLERLQAMRQAGAPYEAMHEIYREQSPFRRGNAYYRTYQAKDGIVTVGCLSDRLRKKMADAVGLHDIRFEPGYDSTSEEVDCVQRAAAGEGAGDFPREDSRRMARRARWGRRSRRPAQVRGGAADEMSR